MTQSLVRAAQHAGEAEAAMSRAADAINALSLTVDDAEIWWRRCHRTVRPIEGDTTVTVDERAVVRVSRDGMIGEAEVPTPTEGDWPAAFEAAYERMDGTGGLPGAPAARRPPPMTFDPDLIDGLANGPGLADLSRAIADNARHEAERVPGLHQLDGFVQLEVERVIVARMPGAVSALTAALTTEVALNGVYGERQRQLHAPESFLPLALLGARTWRTMPAAQVRPGDLKLDEGVVLHPRVFERVLRVFIETFLTAEAREAGRFDRMDGETIAARGLTIIDDPGLDGLALSRGFDDEGQPAVRRALIVHGRLSDLLRRRTTQRPGGCLRRVEAGLVPRTSSLLVERGPAGFHDMVDDVASTVMVQDIGAIRVHPDGRFEAPVRWGMTLERAQLSRLLAPGAWMLRGRLFGGRGSSLLDGVRLSRELVDTGSAIMPYGLCPLTVG